VSHPAEPPPSVRARRIRSFIALDLAEPVRTAVIAYLERLRSTLGGVTWTRAENLHVTLKFVGDVDVERVPALVDRLRTVAAAANPFTLQVAGVGAFPSLARPRVLWVGVAAPALPPLAQAVESACVAEGFVAEPRALRPHVTLGRVRAPGRRGAPDLAWLAADGAREFGCARIESVALFRSDLGSDGARHTALASVPLTGAQPFS
jgi:2'-5' RNA ligase